MGIPNVDGAGDPVQRYSGPSRAQKRAFEREQELKRRRRARYMQILEESALKRAAKDRGLPADWVKPKSLQEWERRIF